MSALMAERRDLGEEGRQESLFEALAPPRVPEAGALPTPREEVDERNEIARLEAFAPAPEAVPPFEATVDALVDEPFEATVVDEPFAATVDAPVDEPFAAPAADEVGERREPRTAGVPLAGPTLDDVMSRVWEGLATGLPAACPVCHGEVDPSTPGRPLAGRCRSCGTTID
jgi:hypothetical protein